MNRMSGENDKFAGNNAAFEAQVSQMSGENDKLSKSNQALSGEIEKLKEQIAKMAAENEKFAENNRKLGEQVIKSFFWYFCVLRPSLPAWKMNYRSHSPHLHR